MRQVAPITLLLAIVLATGATKVIASQAQHPGHAAKHELKIPPQPLGAALQELARQTGSQIIFFSRLTEALTTKGLDGLYTVPKAIDLLLAGSGLTFRQMSHETFEVVAMSTGEQQVVVRDTEVSDPEKPQKGVPEILITGTRGTLNLDIERTEDDVLPYVIFGQEDIEQSIASDVQEFLKYRLPMNTLGQTHGQNVGIVFGARSQVDLRGFGTGQTLILIDGRRTSNAVVNGSLQQQDLNGIALSAVERIDVLPTSSSGIYGGDATGGVINIILRRDYRGAELAVGYDNVFDGEARELTASLTSAFSLEGGATNVSVAAFWSDTNLLARQEREFLHRYRNQAFANTSALWMPPALPPLGYTTNIRSTEGNLTLDDGTALDSRFTFVPIGYEGAMTDGGAALAANSGRYNFDPANTSQYPGATNGERASLVNSPSLESINVMIRREFGLNFQAFLEGSASNSISRAVLNGINARFALPAGAVNNPFQQNIEVMVPVPSRDFTTESRSTDRRVVAGLISHLPGGWRGELDYVWHRSGSRLVAPGYIRRGSGGGIAAIENDPEFNPLRDTNVYRLDFSPYLTELFYGPFETTTRDVTLLLGGPLGSLPGGRPIFSVRLEYRDESFGGGTFEHQHVGEPISIYPGQSQTIRSVLAELRIPLVSEDRPTALARELELQVSARRDDYRINGAPGQVSSVSAPVARTTSELHSVNPTIGLRWKPVEDVVIRASYGTGFLPPNVTQLTPIPPQAGVVPSTLLDPRRGNLPIGRVITVRTGGNPDLEPEKSESLSAGVIYKPKWLDGMRLSLDYTKIDRTDRIAGHPFAIPGLIADEAVFPGRIVRGLPTAEEAAMGWAGPIEFVDLTLLNIALAKTEAYDVQIDYALKTAETGTFDFHVMGTWNRYNKSQTKALEPALDNVGFSGGVLESRLNGGATWKHRRLTIRWNFQYFDSYRTYPAFPNPLSEDQLQSRARLVQIQGSPRVDSQIYHDAFVKYRFEGGHGGVSELIDGIDLIFGVRNVFNTKPPRDQQSYSMYGDPRLASYYLGFRMSLD